MALLRGSYINMRLYQHTTNTQYYVFMCVLSVCVLEDINTFANSRSLFRLFSTDNVKHFHIFQISQTSINKQDIEKLYLCLIHQAGGVEPEGDEE